MKLSIILGIPIAIIVIFVAIYLAQEVAFMKANEILDEYQPKPEPIKEEPKPIQQMTECMGNARCIKGTITEIVDGDTVKVNNQSIRFALASAPELKDDWGQEAKVYIEKLCPVGSSAVVDEDDLQTDGSYGRILGMITCNNINLNSALVTSEYGYISKSFCHTSEFSNEDWAKTSCD